MSFWVVTPCRLVSRQTWASTYESTRRYNSEEPRIKPVVEAYLKAYSSGISTVEFED
jgi:hypothetical protein